MTIDITPAELSALIRNLQGDGPKWKAVDLLERLLSGLPAAKREELRPCLNKVLKKAREEAAHE